MFHPYAQSALIATLAEVDRWNKDQSPKYLNEMIANYTSVMKIDESFVRHNQLIIDAEVSR